MKWYNVIKKFLNTIKQDRATLAIMRDDINSNTTDCAKLQYRLEEAELQIKVNASRLQDLENRKADRYQAG